MKDLKTPVVFVRTGWLKYYDRDKDTNDLVGGGSFNENDVGSESNNFKEIGGRCYGYARTGPSDSYNLFRVWPQSRQSKSQVSGVLTIIVARKPPPGAGQVIIGWYQNSELNDDCYDRSTVTNDDAYGAYNFEAASKDCVLLPVAERTFSIPKGAGGMGQANVYYCFEDDGTPRTHSWIAQAVKFVESYKGLNLLKAKRR